MDAPSPLLFRSASPNHLAFHRTNAPRYYAGHSRTLLLNLIDLLLRLLLALVQVSQHNVTRIAHHPELEADCRNTHLDDTVVVMRLLVLVFPGASHICDGRERVLLEF